MMIEKGILDRDPGHIMAPCFHGSNDGILLIFGQRWLENCIDSLEEIAFDVFPTSHSDVVLRVR